MKKKLFNGLCTALVTPFSNHTIDYQALEKLIDDQLKHEVDAILLCGSTGERYSLTENEYLDLAEFFIKKLNKRAYSILGTGSNNHQQTLENTALAKSLNFDAALIVSPYYVRPNKQGLFSHFNAIADQIDIPIILYNVPSRTALNMSTESIIALAKHPNILGIKQSVDDVHQLIQIQMATEKEDFEIICGDDVHSLYFFLLGSSGLISVASNVIADQMKHWISLLQEQEYQKAQMFLKQYYALMQSLFIDSNPIPVKKILSWLGKCKAEYRLPLHDMDKNLETQLKKYLINILRFNHPLTFFETIEKILLDQYFD